jgi:thioredoxin reductase (NADPH)
MQERVFNTENIIVHWNTETEEIIGDTKVTGARVVNNKSGERQVLPVEGFFVAIGHQPNTAVFKDSITMDETGYIITVPGSSRTNIPGVFASGDAQDKVYRQAVTAAGTGCMAALDAERYLVSEGLS